MVYCATCVPVSRHCVPVFVVHLDALALADRVPRECYEAAPRQSGQAALPGLVSLRAALVAKREQDGRIRPFPTRGQVEVRRNVEAWTAFEDDLLDAEIAAVERAYNARVQRRAFGPLAQVAPHPLAPVLLARHQIGHRGDPRNLALALVEQRGRFSF